MLRRPIRRRTRAGEWEFLTSWRTTISLAMPESARSWEIAGSSKRTASAPTSLTSRCAFLRLLRLADNLRSDKPLMMGKQQSNRTIETNVTTTA